MIEREQPVASDAVIREAWPPEYAVIADLTVAAYRDVGENDEPYYPELADVATRAALVPVLVAVDPLDDLVLGAVTYVPGPGPYHEGDFGPDAASFRMLAVAPEARGRGIGRALVQACIDRAREAGRASVGIYTRPFMHGAQALYRSIGFVPRPDLDWEFAPGEWLHAFVLTL
jgi:ribosomal protein S18 acetylase RimI-like enzyme